MHISGDQRATNLVATKVLMGASISSFSVSIRDGDTLDDQEGRMEGFVVG